MGKTVSFSSSRGDGDLYALLELGPECTAKEIKASYRRLAKRYHPDAPKGGDAERFKAIAKAYAILSREESRRKYDGGRRAWKQPWRAGASSAFDARNSSTTDFKDAFDTFGEKVRDAQKRDEEFYGLGDLFRDLEEDFEQNKKSGGDDTRSSSNFWKHLGEDLLEFLEQNEMPRREDVDNLKPKASQPNPKPKPSRGRAGEKAQAPAFDSIDKELEDLKRKMKRDS